MLKGRLQTFACRASSATRMLNTPLLQQELVIGRQPGLATAPRARLGIARTAPRPKVTAAKATGALLRGVLLWYGLGKAVAR